MMAANEVAKPDLLDLLTQAVRHARPETFGSLILRSDPQAFRLRRDEAAEVVSAVLELGTKYAAELVIEYGTRDPFDISTRLGIRVDVSDDKARYGKVLQYAEYRSRPPQVHLYRTSLEGVNQLLQIPEVSELLGLSDAGPALLAHELFHHLDNLPDRVPAKRVRQVVTVKLGPWSVRSGLMTLPEIAAGSFAQALLSLPFHLKLLDLLAIYWDNPAQAVEWVRVLANADNE